MGDSRRDGISASKHGVGSVLPTFLYLSNPVLTMPNNPEREWAILMYLPGDVKPKLLQNRFAERFHAEQTCKFLTSKCPGKTFQPCWMGSPTPLPA